MQLHKFYRDASPKVGLVPELFASRDLVFRSKWRRLVFVCLEKILGLNSQLKLNT